MSARRKEIIDLIERRPGIRLVEIADELDMDEETVMPAIQGEVTSGAVIASKVKTAGGRDTWAFRFVQKIDRLPNWMVPLQVSQSEPKRRKPYGPRVCTGQTKPQKAIAFLRTSGGQATSEELRKAMELKPEQVPIQFLKAALKDGRLKREGILWILGDNAPLISETIKDEPDQRRFLSEEDISRIADALLGVMLKRLGAG